MKYYKHPKTGEVFAYQNEAERQEWGAPELVEMTQEEVEAHLAPKPPTAEQVRAERDAKIEAVRWRIERHKDELELGNEPLEPLEPLLQYVQDLRDVPAQAKFPKEVAWPIEPELPQ